MLPVFDPIVNIIHQVTESPFLSFMMCEPEDSFLDRLRQVGDSLLSLLFTVNSLLVGESTLASDRAAPDQGVTEDCPLKKMFVLSKNLVGGLAVENFILRLESGRGLSFLKWLLS